MKLNAQEQKKLMLFCEAMDKKLQGYYEHAFRQLWERNAGLKMRMDALEAKLAALEQVLQTLAEPCR